MKESGFSYNTINNHKRSLKASFYIALQDDCVRKKPFDFKLSEVIENNIKEKVALTEEQELTLLSFIKTDNVVKKYNKHHKDNPLPHITPHTLRHTFCTRLASKDMNPKDLQYIMEHSNISITMDWYAYASVDTAKSEVQRLIA